MGKSNKVCPRCGRKMKCQFNGLQHCKCGISWIREEGFFERTPDMIFCLKRVKKGKGPHAMPITATKHPYHTQAAVHRQSYPRRATS